MGLVRVLSFLKSHSSEYLSGQDLSDVLKISRVAVWKHINRIRSLGYKIESKQKLGYKLVKNTELLLPWEIIDGIKTRKIGRRSYYFDSIDSTQAFAKTLTTNPKENGAIIIAQKQTSGKGRMKRKWISPPGGIWFSIVLKPEIDVSLITLFPIAASLALAISIEKTLKKKPELKWPNDITLRGKKAAGILIDLSMESNSIENLILGVGINFKINPRNIEKSIKNTGNYYGVATLVKKNENSNPIKLVQSFLYELEKIMDSLEQRKIREIIKNWTKKSFTIGKYVKVLTSDGIVQGNALRIDNDGALVISQNKKTTRILVGDVT